MHQIQPRAPLSAEDITKFQALLREDTGRGYTPDETELMVRRLLQLYHLCETAGKTPRLDSTARLSEAGRPFTSRELATEATLALRELQEHLIHVTRRPSTWRWVIISLHAALKCSLQAHLVATEPAKEPPEDLSQLFRRVSEQMPELPQVEQAITQLDTLRWKYLAKQLSLWPLQRGILPQLGLDILRVIERLRQAPDNALLVALRERLDSIDTPLVR